MSSTTAKTFTKSGIWITSSTRPCRAGLPAGRRRRRTQRRRGPCSRGHLPRDAVLGFCYRHQLRPERGLRAEFVDDDFDPLLIVRSQNEKPKVDAWNWQGAAILDYSQTGTAHASVSSRTRFPTLFERYSTRFGTRAVDPNPRPGARHQLRAGRERRIRRREGLGRHSSTRTSRTTSRTLSSPPTATTRSSVSTPTESITVLSCRPTGTSRALCASAATTPTSSAISTIARHRSTEPSGSPAELHRHRGVHFAQLARRLRLHRELLDRSRRDQSARPELLAGRRLPRARPPVLRHGARKVLMAMQPRPG